MTYHWTATKQERAWIKDLYLFWAAVWSWRRK